MYRFDTNWLLKKYRKRSSVAKHVEDERERKVLLGVHDRDYHNGQLAENPSKLDYETLNRAYEVIRYYELLTQLYMYAQYFRFYWSIFESELSLSGPQGVFRQLSSLSFVTLSQYLPVFQSQQTLHSSLSLHADSC